MTLLSPTPSRICLGLVTGAHGIRGGVRIKSFTADPRDVGAYGPVCDETGDRCWAIRVTGQLKDVVLAKFDGVTTRDGAEALRGVKLYVDRAALPTPDDEEFYHTDLIGLRADLADGTVLGTVTDVHDVGGGVSLDILTPTGDALMIPFTNAAVPVVDLIGGRLEIVPPAGLFEKPEPPASVREQAEVAAEILGVGPVAGLPPGLAADPEDLAEIDRDRRSKPARGGTGDMIDPGMGDPDAGGRETIDQGPGSTPVDED